MEATSFARTRAARRCTRFGASAILTAAAVASASAAPTTTHVTQLPVAGNGRDHAQAYNNAYAQSRTLLGTLCLGGQLTNVVVTSENDNQISATFYIVTLTLEADCVSGN